MAENQTLEQKTVAIETPEQKKTEIEQKIVQEVSDAVKNPEDSEKIKSLLTENFRNTLKQNKDATKKLLNLAEDGLKKNPDKKELENLINFLEPITKTQNLQEVNIGEGNAE
jgi:hypothetical protein